MVEYGNMETAIEDIKKVMQSYPNAKGIEILEIHDDNFKSTGWKLRYLVAKKESGHISKWWDW